ncbi:hypothetical protein F4678DRAFT_298197 [Xylaria arbuscula]|nr:hypothetical protein F4678DRAFT_298197 [Xylaria arbuscula]
MSREEDREIRTQKKTANITSWVLLSTDTVVVHTPLVAVLGENPANSLTCEPGCFGGVTILSLLLLVLLSMLKYVSRACHLRVAVQVISKQICQTSSCSSHEAAPAQCCGNLSTGAHIPRLTGCGRAGSTSAAAATMHRDELTARVKSDIRQMSSSAVLWLRVSKSPAGDKAEAIRHCIYSLPCGLTSRTAFLVRGVTLYSIYLGGCGLR